MHNGSLINVLVGHRGVGKSSLLKRIKAYHEDQIVNVHIFDLDEEIEKAEGSIQQIFEEYGEEHFRKLEKKYLDKLLELSEPRRQKTFIALGAGYSHSIPSFVNVIWVRRMSDSYGRVFLDRPRLNKEISSMEEYHSRRTEREERFESIYNQQIILREGKYDSDDGEKFFFGLVERVVPYSYTLKGSSQNRMELSIDKYDNWINFFEIRDDILSKSLADKASEIISQKKILYSFRRENSYLKDYNMKHSVVDWALELGECDLPHRDILSIHNKVEGSLDKTIEKLTSKKARFYKLAIEIESFSELQKAHEWWAKDMRHRIFLPCSKDGRWAWYRSQFCYKNFLSFFKDDLEGSAPDQPQLLDIMSYPHGDENMSDGPTEFAAILGKPLVESWTPSFQQSFFNQYQMPVYRIELSEEELTAEVLNQLKDFGLRAAAITSPLKNKMFELVDDENEFRSTNTIVFKNGWKGTNTDIFGALELLKDIEKNKSVVVWGSGGTKEILKEILPQAQFVSARKGLGPDPSASPEFLVWAVGRSRMDQVHLPPDHWRPRIVYDLNYSQSSPGIQVADLLRSHYVPGDKMFFVQGQKQQEFWKKYL